MALTEHIEQKNPGGAPGGDPGDGRRSARVPAAQISGSTRARLLPGGDVDVVNISATGLLVEGPARPAIGTTVAIRLKGARVRHLEGRIVRSKISTIHRDGSIAYETAIDFDRPYAIEEMTGGPPAGTADAGGARQGSDDDVYVLETDNDW